jgi:DNA-directed RNA polymerase subunit RPC12/RpoP
MKKILIALMIVLLAGTGFGQTANETADALEAAKTDIAEMEEAGIPTERVETLLQTANNSYRAQRNFEREGGTADYSRAMELTERIGDIREQALEASDRIGALENRISELEGTSVNLTEAKSHLEAARTDFRQQRFEEVGEDVDAAYSSISEAQSAQTQIESFASAQQRGITSWIQNRIDYMLNNPIKVTLGGSLFLILSWLSLHEARTYRLLKIRERKQIKRDVLEDLIREVQEDYYMKKEGSSVRFETKHEKFEELHRDTVEGIDVIEDRLEGRWSVLLDVEEELREPGELEAEDLEVVEDAEDQEPLQETEEPEEQEEEGEEQEESSEEESGKSDEAEESFECPECGRSFDTERGLHIHQTQIHGGSGYECEICGDEFDTKRGLHIHEGMKHDEAGGVECPDCGRTFDTERGMHIHRGEVHKN